VLKKKKPKYSSTVILSVFLACMVLVVAGVVFIALAANRLPDAGEAIAAEVLIDIDAVFAMVASIDLEFEYPETPQAVMELFNNTFRLLYSRYVYELDALAHILNIQRGLYSSALIEMNAFEGQLGSLLFSREEQEELGLEIIGIYQSEPVPDRFDPGKVVISTIKFANNGQSFHYDFHIFRHPQTDRWEIGLWNNTMNRI